MATINRVPRGLLGLLDAKTGGRTPAEISATIGVGLESLQFYLSDIPLEIEVAQTVPVAVPLVRAAIITVPNNELWIVQHVAWQATVVAGPSDVAALCNIGPVAAGINDVEIMPAYRQPAVPFGGAAGSGLTFNPNLLLGAGTSIGTLIQEVTGQLSVQTRIAYRSLQI